MHHLLSFKFWLNLRPPSLLPIYRQIFIGLIICLIAATFLFWLARSKRKGCYAIFWQRLYSFSLVNVFLGASLLFLDYESIPLLSARFWFLLWGVSAMIWLIFIFKELMKVPEKRKRISKEREYKKYIP